MFYGVASVARVVRRHLCSFGSRAVGGDLARLPRSTLYAFYTTSSKSRAGLMDVSFFPSLDQAIADEVEVMIAIYGDESVTVVPRLAGGEKEGEEGVQGGMLVGVDVSDQLRVSIHLASDYPDTLPSFSISCRLPNALARYLVGTAKPETCNVTTRFRGVEREVRKEIGDEGGREVLYDIVACADRLVGNRLREEEEATEAEAVGGEPGRLMLFLLVLLLTLAIQKRKLYKPAWCVFTTSSLRRRRKRWLRGPLSWE